MTGYELPGYTPVLLPGQYWPAKAHGRLKGGDPVDLHGAGVVRRSAAGSRMWLGVAVRDTPDGEWVPVVLGRVVHQGPAQGPIAAGTRVACSGTRDRQVMPAGASGTPVGFALTSAADGHPVRWAQL